MIFIKNKTKIKSNEIDVLIRQLKSPYAFSSTPVNLRNEKEKFLNSDSYEPRFKYNIVPTNNDRILKELSSIKLITDVDPRISNYYLSLINSKNISNQLYKSIGNNELITKYSKEYYGFPTTKLFNNSILALKGKIKKYSLNPIQYFNSEKIHNSESIVKFVRYFLDFYGFNNFSVIFSAKQSSGVRVGTKDKEFVLGSKDITRTSFELRKLIVHEICTHLFRWKNGVDTKYYVLSILGNIDNHLIEEGLASYSEEYMGLMTPEVLKRKARLTYATYVGENLSFRQLYNVLRASLTKSSAFNTTLRVKRGLGDMSLPGIYTKGIIYFKGYRRVRKAILKDSSIYNKLYAGKISLRQLKWVEEGLIPDPKLLVDKKSLNQEFERLGI